VLVHDWSTGMRGGEQVLESLCRLVPDADLVTLVHVRGSVSAVIERQSIQTSFIQQLPWPSRLYRHYLPLFPTAIELLDLDDADLIVSTSTCAAKAVVPTGRAFHLCYCNAPMRYGWDQFDAYFGPQRLGMVGSAAMRHAMAWLARWDRATAPRVDRFLANSLNVAGRIGRYYNRAASVLYPPVDTEFFTPDGSQPQPYFLVVSALVPYKRLDRAILAARQLNVPLTIVGHGPDEGRLRDLAGGDVRFVSGLSRAELRDAYRQAQAVLLPGEEDFGIVPVEAMACGRPVVALDRGGARETVEHGVTGLLVGGESPEAFADAMTEIGRLPFDAARLRARAETFSTAQFEAALADALAGATGAAA
jgi:glycosyltransferase involved in cell wall biosynthesis